MLAWLEAHPFVSVLIAIWIVAWKGAALWRSAMLQQKWWFTAILVINTFGLLEIFYIFIIARRYKVEVVEN